MQRTFVCSECGLRKPIWKRSHFFNLLAVVYFLYSRVPDVGDEICVDCAPSTKAGLGKILWIAVVVGLLAAVWIWGSRWHLV